MKNIPSENAKNTDVSSLSHEITTGLRDGIPIAMGYFAVAFSLGIIAKKAGLTAALGFVSSFFTRASAGEYGVYTLVAVNATYVELIAMCLVVNLRYMLMSAALHFHKPQGLYPTSLHLFRSPYLRTFLGFRLCCRHHSGRHAASYHRICPQRSPLRYVPRHHNALCTY